MLVIHKTPPPNKTNKQKQRKQIEEQTSKQTDKTKTQTDKQTKSKSFDCKPTTAKR